MCGRYTIKTPSKDLAKYFDALLPKEALNPRTNAAPGQNLPIILETNPRQIVMGHWGYPIHIGPTEKELINTRAESIKEKTFWKKAAMERRCLVLADGFYEWKKLAGRKQPYWITSAKSKPMAFAGIFITKAERQEPLFSIITVPANDFMSKIHERMPVILSEGKESAWLDSNLDRARMQHLLQSFDGKMAAIAAPLSVNNAKNENIKL